MTSTFSWQNSVSLCTASFCTARANLPVTPGISRLPTFAFQSRLMKKTSFCGVSFRSYRSSQNCSNSASSALLVGAQTWITVILNGQPWKRTEIILSFFFFFGPQLIIVYQYWSTNCKKCTILLPAVNCVSIRGRGWIWVFPSTLCSAQFFSKSKIVQKIIVY